MPSPTGTQTFTDRYGRTVTVTAFDDGTITAQVAGITLGPVPAALRPQLRDRVEGMAPGNYVPPNAQIGAMALGDLDAFGRTITLTSYSDGTIVATAGDGTIVGPAKSTNALASLYSRFSTLPPS